MTNEGLYTCGGLDLEFSGMLPNTISMIITIIQIVVPILLVLFGLLDLAKAVMAQKEDEIKKGQQTLLKRVIAAAIVFFVIVIVKLLLSFLAKGNGNKESIVNCFNCFVRGTYDEAGAEGGCKDSLSGSGQGGL